jgi:PAP2 superfamily protein
MAVERSLGMFFEPTVHAWVAARPALMKTAEWGYATIHLPLMLGVLAWVWVARPMAFRLARNTFVVAQTLLVAGYVLVPTAPPRLVPSLGFGASLGAGSAGVDRMAMSPYAAMPSGHAAFAVIAAAIVVCLARSRLVRLTAALYPLAILVEIIATGNHFWIDAAAGAAVAVVAFGLVLAIDHRGGRRAWQVARSVRGGGQALSHSSSA